LSVGIRAPRVTRVSTPDELADAAARMVVEHARTSIAARGRFTLVLTGGSTPGQAYARLASHQANAIAWDRTHVFLSDERWVPASDARSNYGMAREALLSKVPIPAAQVHPMVGGGDTPEADAQRYEHLLRSNFSDDSSPAADLTLLGVGPDGHVASLFPGDPAVEEKSRWVLSVQAPDAFDVRDRVTLTLPFLNRSRHVLFMASGAAKRDVVKRVLDGEPSLPASLVRGVEATDWLVAQG
jgi:6-phosphogluconolactonase